MLSRTLDLPFLCRLEPALEKFYRRDSNSFDFGGQAARVTLTQLLIKLDLGYRVTLCEEYLCPNYFNRRDYVVFVRQLLELTPGVGGQAVVGLDIGTSQSCIYPLLATRYVPNLAKIYATDSAPAALALAEQTVRANQLQGTVEPTLVDPAQNAYAVMDGVLEDNSAAFTMCNPPFYSSGAEMLRKLASKKTCRKAATVGQKQELVTPGGDYQFVTKLIDDSVLVKDRVIWFTSLVGHHSTLLKLVAYLNRRDPPVCFGVHRFQSGAFTTRWILFWTYKTQYKPPIELFNYRNARINCNKYVKRLDRHGRTDDLLRRVLLQKLTRMPYVSLHLKDTLTVTLPGNVFSRSYRRTQTFRNDGSVYIFEIRIQQAQIVWRGGFQYTIFESFVNVMNSC